MTSHEAIPTPLVTSSHDHNTSADPGRLSVGNDDRASSMRSAEAHSGRSSSTIKARRAAAEALYKRRQYERSQALMQELAAVEEAEYRAELIQIDAENEGSLRSRNSTRMNRTHEWVQNFSNSNLHNNADVELEVSKPDFLVVPPVTPQVAVPSLTAHLSHPTQTCVLPEKSGLAAAMLPSSHVGFNGQRGHATIEHNDLSSPLLLQAIADTAAAAKALASQDRLNKPKIELFSFSGSASQWLQFRKMFDTTKPSYSPAENIARLQNALRGHAREAVASLLVSAEDPEEIMRALERSFACPEMIVLGEVQILKSLPRLGNDLKELISIANKVRNSLSTIKLLKQNEYLHSPELFYCILGKLNPNIKMRWTDYASEFSSTSSSRSKLELLSDFLTREQERHIKFGLILEAGIPQATQQLHITSPLQHNTYKYPKRDNIHSVTYTNSKTDLKTKCVYCDKDHNIKLCDSFKSLSVDDRWRWLRENKVCYKCLRRNSHQWKSCKVNPCRINGCLLRHHPLLHGRQNALTLTAPDTQCFSDTVCATTENNVRSTSSPVALRKQSLVEEKIITSNTGLQHESVSELQVQYNTFLKVVPITVFGPAGSYDTYALLDDGSTATLIDSSVATRIGLSGPENPILVEGIGGLHKKTNVNLVDFKIKGKYVSEIYPVTHARAMKSLSLHAQTLPREKISSYRYLIDLADVLSYNNVTPTVLIGAQHWYLSITRETRCGKSNEPVACRTLLGWTLYGETSSKTKPVEFVNHCKLASSIELSENERLEILIKEQYKLDSLGICKRETLHSKQDLRAIEILDSTIKRLESGRFEVALPWRDDIGKIPDSYPQALSRFLSLEKRMLRDFTFADSYNVSINNMIAQGYAEECDISTYYDCHIHTEVLRTCPTLNSSVSSISPDTAILRNNMDKIRFYLPHFGVYHPQKRKLRVVHDAAATNQGVSLNSMLLQGPDLLKNLLGILFRFREGRVAMTADIKEMFLQIRIREQDRNALRFLWRDVNSKATEPIKEYRMTSVIFGASSSPFIALYVKNKNAEFHRNLHPVAVDAIIHDHYMDDYVGSLDDVNQAAQLASDIVKVHGAGCFEMRGWISNDNKALRLLTDDLRAVPSTQVQFDNQRTDVKVLGVTWNPLSDTIGVRTGFDSFSFKGNLSKRKVLSHLMKIYDPLGLLGPIVIKGRILLQEVWRSKIDWDTPFSPAEVTKWNEWFKELTEVASIKILRWYTNHDSEPLFRELHVFADASELAYACVAYWRFLYPDGTVKLALITSKARVSPLKPTSIPRLELQAALIASRLAVTIKDCHRKKPIHTFLWTDSRTVLSWLRSDARTFKPFVAHRIGEITEISSVKDWRWVPTGMNVADDATRMNPIHLDSNHRWFTGPSFLFNSPENWPIEPEGPVGLSMVQEERKQFPEPVSVHLVVTADFNRFSSWLRLLRATARVLQIAAKFRLILNRIRNSTSITDVRDHNFPSPSSATSITLPPLSSDLINAAERHVLQRVQEDCFKEELQCVKNSKSISKTSRLFKLSPSLGDDGLLHLRGRIGAVQDVSADVKFPVLLDGRHPIVRLLVQYFHKRTGHANNETVINEMRQKFWILRLRNTVRSIAKDCLFCSIRKTKPMNPTTGDLPPERLAHHRRPFTFTGLDYFGPLYVTIGRRHEKRYVALFTCMTSRAVHLELVHNLSTDSAIMCLRRFIARRGLPDTIYSDNGTCFIGANRVLKDFYHSDVQDFAANRGIKWNFIPPAAPFFGGSWERMVRSIKVALNASLFEKAPKEEILLTLLLEAEAIVNSRPLTHVSVDHDDEASLTPFHFLIGSSSNQILPSGLEDRDLMRRIDWKKVLRLADHFWKRWVHEYLPTLQPRQNNVLENNLKINDVVLIVDENLPRGTWPRGRITTVYPGKDGVVRVVDVETKGGLLRRPCKKIVKLVTEESIHPGLP